MKRLGERIKRKRESLNMQLNELSEKVGISASALSQIEKAKAHPSIVTLKTIADNLHATVGELIGEHEALTNNPLMKFDAISFVEENDSGCASYLLSNHGPGKHMDTLLLKFKPGADSYGIVKKHPGQAFFFVLSGNLSITLDNDTYQLKQKDSFYLNSSREHQIKNTSNNTAQVIYVSTPPV